MRQIEKTRKTKETDIIVNINIDGLGNSEIKTGIEFLDHLLPSFALCGFFDLNILSKTELGVGAHKANEDLGAVLGQAFKEALGKKEGIKRFGCAYVPIGQALARVAVDAKGSGELCFTTIPPEAMNLEGSPVNFTTTSASKENYSLMDLRIFVESFAKHSGITLNIGVLQKDNIHHQAEAILSALGIALDEAIQIDSRRKVVLSAGQQRV